MDKQIRWGILGAGRIAQKFASDLKLVEDAELFAVASRGKANAATFAALYPAARQYDNYESLVQDPGVDVVYIATPHGLHYEHTMLCVQHGKAVLCEKAFALHARQAKEMISAAQRQKVFLMEALWSKFIPSWQTMMEMIGNGKLGEIKNVLINFGFIPQAPVADRLYNPALGGGTLLDIGIYNVFYALSALGKPDHIEARMTPAATGVDEQCAVLFRYNNGAMAQLFSSYSTHLATEAGISGNKGRLRLTHRFYTPETTVEFYPGRADTKTIVPVQHTGGWGYHYEAGHVGECLRRGLTESPVMTHADTLMLMETLDEIRRKAGICYPADEA
ncbi:Gfo/Idh/MocA family oxidoreductase [Agriterribacter sp.]|uniref:Gfo/Idh/MocA family protein n=1 Tax=Agriterribacter sp. TaxID=2821509 RepID=UPI002C97AD97|nr:Gfo/Idh/MocA family oxidoreductase [Agriterribacter sp.]HRP57734.1 Gfo/Idh/MocA family oxidoreductase [Agriterribacter sp.]